MAKSFYIPIRYDAFDRLEFKRYIRKYGLEGKGLMLDVLIALHSNENSLSAEELTEALDMLYGDNIERYLEMIEYCDDIQKDDSGYHSKYISEVCKSITDFNEKSAKDGAFGANIRHGKDALIAKDVKKFAKNTTMTIEEAFNYVNGTSQERKAMYGKMNDKQKSITNQIQKKL